MTYLVAVMLAGLTGFAAYTEAVSFEARNAKGPLGQSARRCAAIAFVVGAIVALLASALVLAAVVAFGGYRAASWFERQHGEPVWGISAPLFAAGAGIVGLFGALFTSTVLWGLVCAGGGLTTFVFVLLLERKHLIAERNRLNAENSRLIAESARRNLRAPSRAEAPPAPAPAPAPAPVRTPAPAPAPVAFAPQPASMDFLPRR